jgi:cellulose synthase/poly-beta-1,6-N-acetylglucosamine synthase-like glycosyltransferase
MKLWLGFVVGVMCLYAIRHFMFTRRRLYGSQRLYYQDILDAELPTISILVPMHNEEAVAKRMLENLLKSEYPTEKLEIIVVDDHSDDKTPEILDELEEREPLIKVIHRTDDREPRGKPLALNTGLKQANGEIVIVFDADYFPARGALRDLAVCFKDPEVGAAMGRVIPLNTKTNLLTRLLDLERSGGYQVDQQARHDLLVIPQYGGTVGGFRRDVVRSLEGFDPDVLAEDTDLTFRLLTKGWKVVYANRVECYEQVPETWVNRARQIRRWSRGHNQVMLRRLTKFLGSRYLTRREKWDGFLLLSIYTVPFLLLTGIVDSVALFFMGRMQLLPTALMILFVAGYNSFGNFAPFYQVGTAALLDGTSHRIRLLPMLMFYFLLNIWVTTVGLFDSLVDVLIRREPEWQKTKRSAEERDEDERRNDDGR